MKYQFCVTPLPPPRAEVLLLPLHLCFACEETVPENAACPNRVKDNFFFFLVVLGLRCCLQAISSCSEQRLLFLMVKMLVVVASRVAWSTGSGAHGLH